MFKKSYSATGRKCRVMFELSPEVQTQTACLCGDFNDWNEASHPLKRRKNGSFGLTLWLDAGRQYRFRYLLDGDNWENDPQADAYVPNPFGTEDSVIEV